MNYYNPYKDEIKEKHLKLLEDWLLSYKPKELFDKNGKLKADIRSTIPNKGKRIRRSKGGKRKIWRNY